MDVKLHSKTVPAKPATAPLAVVLSEHAPGRYCTHLKNMTYAECFWGHYDLSWEQAVWDFHDRWNQINK